MPLPPREQPKRKKRGATTLRAAVRHPAVWLGLLLACLAGGGAYLATGCSGWSPDEPFERNAPDVDRALELYDSGQFASAEEVLEEYLSTGPCEEGKLGLPPRVRDKFNGSYDLGLVLFHLAEKYGRRFGEEEVEAPETPEDEELYQKRTLEIDCALIIVGAIAQDVKVPVDLRARAFYVAGNLEFLRREYAEAVKHYDAALQLIPGLFPEAGDDLDGIGRDAAWNRAIALRRIEEQDAGADGGEDAEADAEPDAGEEDGGDGGGDEDGGDAGEDQDGGDGSGPESGDAGGVDSGENDGGEDGGDSGENPENPGESGGDDPENPNDPDEGDDEDAPPDQGEGSQRDRVLDELEEAPTYQEEESKQNANRGKRKVMEDK